MDGAPTVFLVIGLALGGTLGAGIGALVHQELGATREELAAVSRERDEALHARDEARRAEEAAGARIERLERENARLRAASPVPDPVDLAARKRALLEMLTPAAGQPGGAPATPGRGSAAD